MWPIAGGGGGGGGGGGTARAHLARRARTAQPARPERTHLLHIDMDVRIDVLAYMHMVLRRLRAAGCACRARSTRSSAQAVEARDDDVNGGRRGIVVHSIGLSCAQAPEKEYATQAQAPRDLRAELA